MKYICIKDFKITEKDFKTTILLKEGRIYNSFIKVIEMIQCEDGSHTIISPSFLKPLKEYRNDKLKILGI